MGFIDGVKTLVSVAKNFVGEIAGKVGTAVSEFAKNTIGVIAPIPGIGIVQGISIVAKIVHTVAKVLGVKSEDEPEILGAKVEQTDKKMEDFANDVEAYIEYLNEEVQLDEERYEQLSVEEKLGCKAVGLTLEAKAIEQKIGGVKISPECLEVLTKLHAKGVDIDAKALISVVNVLKDQGITDLNDVAEYLKGTGKSDKMKTGDAFATALGENADEKIDTLMDKVREFE